METIAPNATTITYEQPLNESIRLCLRLEHLLQQLYNNLAQPGTIASRLAIIALLKTMNVVDRPDLKSKLTQTLSQQASTLAQLKHAPQVDNDRLQKLLEQMDHMIDYLHHITGKIGERLRQNTFLTQVRLHIHNPAGLCHFNIPAYALWLQQADESRLQQLQQWASEFKQLNAIVKMMLTVIRDSVPSQHAIAQQGFYQLDLDPNLTCQLIRLNLPVELNLYPEISVGKHRIAIRFLELDANNMGSSQQTHDNVVFQLSCCRI